MSDTDRVSVEIKNRVLNILEFKEEVSDEMLEELIANEISTLSRTCYLTVKERVEIGKKVLHSMRKLDILQDLLDDPDVTEIMVNGYSNIFVEKSGQLYKSDKTFDSEDRLTEIIQQIVAGCNRVVNDTNPIVDARLAEE